MSVPAPSDLVTVVIATYNMGKYLPEAVESVLAQTYPNVEVQVVDDGSADDTPAVVRRWADHPRVRVHRQDNGGQARAKNQGVSLSRGEFVAFLDADDIWLPDKLARQMPLFAGRPRVGVVYSEYENMDDQGRLLQKSPTKMHRGRVSAQLLVENFISFPTAIVRKEYLTRWGAFDERYRMGIDYELWLRLSAHCEFDFVPQPTVRYRIWSGQMSKDYRRRYDSAIQIMRGFLDANPDAVQPTQVKTAWAHTYTGRGNVILWQEKDRKAAMRDYARALRFQPAYWPAWRSILRSLLTMRAP